MNEWIVVWRQKNPLTLSYCLFVHSPFSTSPSRVHLKLYTHLYSSAHSLPHGMCVCVSVCDTHASSWVDLFGRHWNVTSLKLYKINNNNEWIIAIIKLKMILYFAFVQVVASAKWALCWLLCLDSCGVSHLSEKDILFVILLLTWSLLVTRI